MGRKGLHLYNTTRKLAYNLYIQIRFFFLLIKLETLLETIQLLTWDLFGSNFWCIFPSFEFKPIQIPLKILFMYRTTEVTLFVDTIGADKYFYTSLRIWLPNW